MAEVWFRIIGRSRDLLPDLSCISRAVEDSCGERELGHREGVSKPFRFGMRFNPTMTIKDPLGERQVVTPAEMEAALRSFPVNQSRHLLVIAFIENDKYCKYTVELGHLVCLFPEVTFRFVVIGENGVVGNGPDGKSWLVIESADGIKKAIEAFQAGDRYWYDPLGIRSRYRSFHLWKLETQEYLPPKYRCVILEDERDYAELLAYSAYRSGLYHVSVLAEASSNPAELLPKSADKGSEGVFIHAFDVPGLPPAENGEPIVSWLKKYYETALEGYHLYRMVVTGASSKEITVIEPQKWRSNGQDYLGWKDGDQPNHLRGRLKPLGWVHDLWSSGLFPQWATCPRPTMHALLDGGLARTELNVRHSHSAPAEAEALADELIARSRCAMDQRAPLVACLTALEAVRCLRGNSATLFMDSIQSLYDAESELEINVASTGRRSKTFAVGARKAELDGLLKHLTDVQLIPAGMVPEVKERIWMSLRQRYLDVGAFEPAEEALAFIHDAQRERVGNSLRGTLLGKTVLWSLLFPLPLLNGVMQALARILGRLPRYMAKGWEVTKEIATYFPKSPLGTVCELVLFMALFVIWLFAPSYSSADPGWVPLIPIVVLLTLGLIWLRRWPRVALAPGIWISAALLSVVVLSVGNLAILSDASPPDLIEQHRWRSWGQCLEWTCGCALMAQVMPTKFLYPDRPVVVDPESQKTRPGYVQFGWRGRTPENAKKGDSDSLDFDANSKSEIWRTFLWLENIITGWLTFATGLSTLYRRASRG